MIDCYLQAFAKLRTDKNRQRWEARTCFRAPHKPFLLLSILDLVAQGLITRDFIESFVENYVELLQPQCQSIV